MVNFNLIDDSQDLKVELLDDNNEIEFSMTDYDDTEVKKQIQELDNKKADKTQVNELSNQVSANTAQINQNKDDISTLNTKVDNIHIPTKTSELTNDSGFITSDYHDDTKQDKLISGQNIKTINNESILGSGNIEIEADVKQVYRGAETPDNNILIWIETTPPVSDIQLLTKNDEIFITSEDENFILKEEI